MCSLAISIKWTGLSFLGIIGLSEIILSIKNKSLRRFWQLVPLTILVTAIYASFFVIHLKILYKSGSGNAYMTYEFKKTLQDNDVTDESIKPLSMFDKIVELNVRMHTANAGLKATHPYGTKSISPEQKEKCLKEPEASNIGNCREYAWYTWPFMARTIFYWNGGSSDKLDDQAMPYTQRIYLLGNPLVWWGSTFAILYLIITFLSEIPSYIKRQKNPSLLLIILLIIYAINFVPLGFVDRSLFLYHYFASLVIAIIGLAYIMDQLPEQSFSMVIKNKTLGLKSVQTKTAIIALFVLASAILFVYFAPISYGLDLTEKQFSHRMWFKSWR